MVVVLSATPSWSYIPAYRKDNQPDTGHTVAKLAALYDIRLVSTLRFPLNVGASLISDKQPES